MNQIQHIKEPNHLLLVWQEPERSTKRYVIGEVSKNDSGFTFNYFPESEDFSNAIAAGLAYYPAFRKVDKTYNENVLDSFLRRLPPRKRADFPQYLEQLRLPPDAEVSDFALMAYSGAKLPSDGFSLVWPLNNISPPFEMVLTVAGVRFNDYEPSEIAEGMEVNLIHEPDNPADSKAIMVKVADRRIGYINRVQRDAVDYWLEHFNVEAEVERINGTEERPMVYIFCRVTEK